MGFCMWIATPGRLRRNPKARNFTAKILPAFFSPSYWCNLNSVFFVECKLRVTCLCQRGLGVCVSGLKDAMAWKATKCFNLISSTPTIVRMCNIYTKVTFYTHNLMHHDFNFTPCFVANAKKWIQGHDNVHISRVAVVAPLDLSFGMAHSVVSSNHVLLAWLFR